MAQNTNLGWVLSGKVPIKSSVGRRFRVAAERLRKDICAENLLAGAKTKQSARDLVQQMMQLLKAGGFTLCKWAANDPELLSDIPVACKDTGLQEIILDAPVTTLDLLWNPASHYAKRQLLSNIVAIYDPLQCLASMTVGVKILM